MSAYDLIVIGAGPAGSAAAITAARLGRSVLVIDKATFPREKICGDGLTSLALHELEQLRFDPSDVASWTPATEVVVSGPSGHTETFTLPDGPGVFSVIARRSDLDAALIEHARTEGAEVRLGDGLAAITERTDRVEIQTESGFSAAAPWVIAADGMWSPTRKMLGFDTPKYRGEWHAFRQYFRSVSDLAATTMFVSFEADILSGYFWSFPLPDGTANVGFGIERPEFGRGKVARVQDMGPIWADLLQRPHIAAFLGPNAVPEGPHRAWPIPARIDQATWTTDRVLFVGDAVCAADPLTGEGIGQALFTGRIAAESVCRALVGANPLPQWRATAAYCTALRRRLVPDHRMANLLATAMSHRKGARAAIRVAGATAWTRKNFARWLLEDYPRAVALQPSEWAKVFANSPGAYVSRSSASEADRATAPQPLD